MSYVIVHSCFSAVRIAREVKIDINNTCNASKDLFDCTLV